MLESFKTKESRGKSGSRSATRREDSDHHFRWRETATLYQGGSRLRGRRIMTGRECRRSNSLFSSVGTRIIVLTIGGGKLEKAAVATCSRHEQNAYSFDSLKTFPPLRSVSRGQGHAVTHSGIHSMSVMQLM